MNNYACTLMLGVLFIATSCSTDQTKGDHKETTITIDSESSAKEIDSILYAEIIFGLEGIEKFYVRNDFFRLLNLLEYQKDERALDLREGLESMSQSSFSGGIVLLDKVNGYVVYNNGAQVDVEMTYWNQSDGNKLIATTPVIRTQSMEDLTFEMFDGKNGQYYKVRREQVIQPFDKLEKMIVAMDPSLGADGGCMFKLPQKGKNITFCADDNCVDLVWKDGVFEIE